MQPADWVARAVDAERRGELLDAADLAERGLEEHPGNVSLQYRSVLALARAGSTGEAAGRFAAYGLGELDDGEVQALGARIAKDVALGARGRERQRLALESAERYAAIFDRTGAYYPGVNAATMHLVADRRSVSRSIASRVLDALAANGDGSYYAVATEAEARLLLGDVERARTALERAAELGHDDHGAVATTRRQLRLVLAHLDLEPEVLAVLGGPRVAHYCGHRVSVDRQGPLTSDTVASAEAAIREELARNPVAYAYGSLASGADLLWAETLLATGAELHVVLPFSRDEFVEASVADAGPEWVARFERCLGSASAVSYATDDAFLGDDVLYRYGSELAMGLALLRGRFLEGEVMQLALWDGAPARGGAGTAVDVETWRRAGRPVTLVPVAPASPSRPRPNPEPLPPRGRVVRALLFGDIQGFSKLSDEQLPRFAEHVLGAFAGVFSRHADTISFRNTWGDGLYLVVENTVAAARCALELQETMASLDLDGNGLPEHLGLRLAAHVGPVFPLRDPVLGLESFMGSHVSRTARVEPVTPPGCVYVTEPFAAALELASAAFACDYVGHMPAAKDFGRLRMYRLRRAQRNEE